MRSPVYLVIVAFVVMTGFVSVGFADETVASPVGQPPVAQANEPNAHSLPYTAEVTSDDVYIRSGPGTQYYYCGKLNKTNQVKVVGRKFSWSQIVPPAGSFSWISTQYVRVDPNNSSEGIVTGDNVRVYAGSDDVKPIHSTTVQGKLDRDSKVTLIGEQEGDYYKISPPPFAYLWISSVYTKPLESSAGEVLVVAAEAKPAAESNMPAKSAAEPNAVVSAAPPVIKNPIEVAKLREYHDLEKQLQVERAKPVLEQNYANLKKALAAIAANDNAGKAARYAEFALGQIKRYELAMVAVKETQLQDSQLQQVKEQIDKAHNAKLAEVPDLGRFAVIGKFQPSNIYGKATTLKYYRIVDDSGKTLCYALPAGSAADLDLSGFIDRNVGLVGSVEPHPQTQGALVRFTEITELK